MTKQQQEEKRILEAQKQASKQEVEKRHQALLQKEFYVREWKAEIDLMKYEMEYHNVVAEYKLFKEVLNARQNEINNKQAETTNTTIEVPIEQTTPPPIENEDVKDN